MLVSWPWLVTIKYQYVQIHRIKTKIQICRIKKLQNMNGGSYFYIKKQQRFQIQYPKRKSNPSNENQASESYATLITTTI